LGTYKRKKYTLSWTQESVALWKSFYFYFYLGNEKSRLGGVMRGDIAGTVA
jgi:hypothetical protein